MIERETVTIVGGGFTGTVLAANLLRSETPVRVVLVHLAGPIGRGVAYGTRVEAHFLNVPAGRMSALADDRGHFLRYARQRDPRLDARSFAPRRMYGDYLEDLLRTAERQAAERSSLEILPGRAVGIEPHADGASVDVRLEDGSAIRAARAVLATGNYAPRNPAIADRSFYETDLYVRDPWAPGALDAIGPSDRVLLIGTGLTMMDIAIDLRRRGVAAPLLALSRRGLVPRANVPGDPGSDEVPPFGTIEPPYTAARYLRAVRRAMASAEATGGNWRVVVSSLRRVTPVLWRALSLHERGRFLRHLRPYWDVHRHRAAPATAAAVAGMIAQGELTVRAGRILAYEPGPDGVAVKVLPRGSSAVETLRVDRVVNCAGPETDMTRLDDPLIQSLLATGQACPDPLGLGLLTDDNGALVDARGGRSRSVYIAGPLMRARHWECTAVQELREQAARLGQILLSSLAPRPAARSGGL